MIIPETMNNGTARRVKLFIPENIARATSAGANLNVPIRFGSIDINPKTPPMGRAMISSTARSAKNKPIVILFLLPFECDVN